MNPRLPPLRRRRRRLNVTAVATRLSAGVAKIDASIEPYARWWDHWNQQALSQDGPRWIALGDSVTQGIGASSPERSFAMLTLHRLREETGESWQLINLSMSGGRFADVTGAQLRVLDEHRLEPALVTAVIGSNDVIWRRNTASIVGDAQRLVDGLPSGTLLSRVSGNRQDRRRRGVNEVFDRAAGDGNILLFEAWELPPGRDMWADDNFHPSDAAHRHLSDNLYRAVDGARVQR